MPDEYISREAVYPLAKTICDAIRTGEYSPVVMPHKILDWIDDIPAADVRPVVRGKWINITRIGFGTTEGECSFCGHKSTQPWAPYCPWCNADMREVEHD